MLTAAPGSLAMKDVAAMAGVSLSTVSRVVNGSPPVAPELSVKVERAIEMLGYRHNHTAGSLRRASGLTASIGLIFEDVGNPFFAAIHRGVEDIARQRSVVTFAGSSDADAERERELVENVLARRVDGLILVPTAQDHSYLRRDVAAGIGLVFVDRPPETIDADCVLSDNRGGARQATEHLLTGPDRPTALFTAQNLISIDVLRTLHRLGLQNEVAHVGFDDIPLGASIEPGMTVVAQDAIGLGRAAAELLFSRLDGHRGPARKVVLGTTLIERGSGELQTSS